MAFQFDRIGFAALVERAGIQIGLHPFQEDLVLSISTWRRGWNFVWRRWVGDQCWQEKLKFEQTRKMLAEIRRCLSSSQKPTLVYLIPYDISKMQSGGSKRISGIAKVLSTKFSVFILTPMMSPDKCSVVHLNPDCHLVSIPVDSEFVEQCQTQKMLVGEGLFSLSDHLHLLPTFQGVLDLLAKSAYAWGFASPVAWPIVQIYRKNMGPVFYDAHDDYAHYLQSAFGCTEERLIQRMIRLEREVVEQVDVAIFCTASDVDAVATRFPTCVPKMILVPNGVDAGECRVCSPFQANIYRSQVGMIQHVAVFIGAHHKPNLEAVEQVVSELAPTFPTVVFVIVGIHYFAYRATGRAEPSENVVFTGPVSEDTKEAIFALADVALAPMKSGTGSSLKIPEYIAHGKVVVGTPIGFRGFEDLAQFSSIVVDVDVANSFLKVLEQLEKNSDVFTDSCRNAQKWIEIHLDWKTAVRPLLDRLTCDDKRLHLSAP